MTAALSKIELIIMRLHCMSKYITKEINYFTDEHFNNEIEELKKDYYVIGYVANKQEGRAFVAVVKREQEEHE